MAFGVRDYQISGPDWMSSERFDIVAKIPPLKGEGQEGPRLQKLLADRFKLAVHRESKEFPVYALVVAKGGAKIQPVEDKGEHNTNSNNTHMTGKGITMARLAEFLARHMDKPVVDMTEMKGVFNLDVPSESKAYLHRVGRTGRAGARGEAISLMTDHEVRLVRRYGRELGMVLQHVRLRAGRVIAADDTKARS